MNERKVMKNLDILGQQYCDGLSKPKVPESNWWNGLDFFFNRSFNRGRRDELSLKYMTFTKEVLKNRYNIDIRDFSKSYQRLIQDYKKGYFNKNIILNFKEKHGISKKENCVNHKKFNLEVSKRNLLVESLTKSQKITVDYTFHGGKKKQEDVHLGNDKDVLMVLDTLKFISDKSKMNIYNYVRNTIKTKGVSFTYKLLTEEETGISYIGDKLATLIIRDIILMNPKLIDRRGVDYEKMFPVDTWVRQIYKKMVSNQENVSDSIIKKYYIKKCEKYGFSPPNIAAGLWFLSFKSLDLLIVNLDRIVV